MASKMILPALLGILLASGLAAMAATEVLQFNDAGEEQRYRNLIAELRCLVCQNQSLSDSDADLAKDLRDQVYTMVRAGQSNDDIVDYLVARYGDFVRYRPPFNAATLVLWVGPFLLLAIGALVLTRTVRKRSPAATAREPSPGTYREKAER